jgi:hypothetical protein
MTEPDIFARLTALHSALVEKLGGQPFIDPALTLRSDGTVSIYLYDKPTYDGGTSKVIGAITKRTIATALDAADAFVAVMPDCDAKAKHDWHKDLEGVIDRGHDLALPDAVMQPLRASSQAMHENLLGAPVTLDEGAQQ